MDPEALTPKDSAQPVFESFSFEQNQATNPQIEEDSSPRFDETIILK